MLNEDINADLAAKAARGERGYEDHPGFIKRPTASDRAFHIAELINKALVSQIETLRILGETRQLVTDLEAEGQGGHLNNIAGAFEILLRATAMEYERWHARGAGRKIQEAWEER